MTPPTVAVGFSSSSGCPSIRPTVRATARCTPFTPAASCPADIARRVIGCETPFNSRDDGSKHVSMTWRAISARPYRREPPHLHRRCPHRRFASHEEPKRAKHASAVTTIAAALLRPCILFPCGEKHCGRTDQRKSDGLPPPKSDQQGLTLFRLFSPTSAPLSHDVGYVEWLQGQDNGSS